MEDSKKPWESKTVIVNLIVAIVAFFPGIKEELSPEVIMMFIGVVNIILRLVTKNRISLE